MAWKFSLPRLRRTLFGRTILAAFLILLTQTALLFFFGLNFLNRIYAQAEQARHLDVAPLLAGRIDSKLARGESFAEIRSMLSEYQQANPYLGLYIVAMPEQEGGGSAAAVEFALPGRGETRRQSIPAAPLQQFVEGYPQLELPLFVADPAGDQQAIFSAARLEEAPESRYLLVTLPTSFQERLNIIAAENSLALIIIAIMLAATLASMSLGALILGMLTKRFRQIVSAVTDFTKQGTATAIPVETDDELGRLAAALNSMSAQIGSQLEELAQRDRLRRELVANVSHDLGTPSTVLSAHAEMLLHETAEAAAVRSHAESILRNSQAIQLMLQDLNELSRLEAAEPTIRLESFDACEFLAELCESSRIIAERKGVRLEVACEGPLSAVGDLATLERAVMNLLMNAVRHCGENDAVILRAQRTGEGIEFSVEDTGPGVAAEDREKLFERFVQGRGPVGISGLGLSIVRRLLALQGSEIRLRDSQAGGACFYFLLPEGGEER